MSFIVKDDNFNNIVMTNDFEALDKPLMVEIVRKRAYPGRMNDIRISKLLGSIIIETLIKIKQLIEMFHFERNNTGKRYGRFLKE